MAIESTLAYVVQCDICHRTLTSPNRSEPRRSWQIETFLTPAIARTAAIASEWTIGRELVACPKCSPITGPSPTQTPTPPHHVRYRSSRPPNPS